MLKKKTQIIPYNPKYKKEVINLFKTQPEIFEPELIYMINEKLLDKKSLKYIFLSDSEVVGFISASLAYDSKDIWELGWIAVRKDYQHQGLGSELLKYLEKKIKSQKVKKIFLETVHSKDKVSKATVKFYRKNKYKEVGLIPNYWGKGIDKLFFFKDLK